MNLELLMERLEELGNAQLQENLWLGKVEGEMSSFTEAVCGVFDDAGLTHALDSQYLDRNYSKELCALARKLSRLTNEIDDAGTPIQTLAHPRMPSVRIAAKELIRLFAEESNHDQEKCLGTSG